MLLYEDLVQARFIKADTFHPPPPPPHRTNWLLVNSVFLFHFFLLQKTVLFHNLISLTQSYGANRQYSYSPIVLGRVGLDHECETHAENFSPRGQTNMRKLPLSLPNLRKIFHIVKFRRAYILERSLFQTTKGRSAHYCSEKQRY